MTVDRETRPFGIASALAAALGIALLAALPPAEALAQQALDAQVGRWAVPGEDPTYYSAALWRDAWGPFGYSLRGLALVDGDSAGRSLYGAGPDITLLRGMWDGRLTAYAMGGSGLALAAGGSTDIVAVWSAGVGIELRAPTLFSATLEARRFSEDGHFRGFWNLRDEDRRGWLVSLGFSFRWGGGPTGPGDWSPPNLSPASGAGEPYLSEPGEAGAAAPGLATSVVQTALAAMGEPYRWGGTSTDQGFDCSGLVWYAYAEHGVRLPRVSRDQARAGRPLPAELARLRPGDILLFADRPGAVTHVGLYVGEARFIHATTSGGVRIGSLDGSSDASERWYLSRWVGARRVLD